MHSYECFSFFLSLFSRFIFSSASEWEGQWASLVKEPRLVEGLQQDSVNFIGKTAEIGCIATNGKKVCNGVEFIIVIFIYLFSFFCIMIRYFFGADLCTKRS